ncbi:MAG: cobalamin-dependent protein [Candidatus Eremiobacteraeota bacterium]|nr:cobalamin-dependent protein [Candidatus Eremiobacteraeota bacterium]
MTSGGAARPFRLALVSLQGEGLWGKPIHYFNPLAVTTLAGYVKEALAPEIRLFDTFITSIGEIAASLRAFSPHLLGISMKTDSLLELKKLMEAIGTDDPPFPAVLGGIAPSIIDGDLLSLYPRAFVVRGEGEIPLAALIRHIAGQIPRHEVPALSYLDEGGALQRNAAVPLDLPSYHSQPFDDLTGHCITTDGDFWLESGRGCRRRCSFCTKGEAHCGNRGCRRFPLERTLERMASIEKKFGIRRFRFSDEDFFDNDFTFLKDFLAGLGELPFIALFEVDVNVRDIISPGDPPERARERRWLLESLVEKGLTHVFIGIESLSDTQLRRYRKGSRVSQITAAAGMLRELSISCSAGFIPFDPFVTVPELAENFRNLRDTGIIAMVNTPLKVLRLQKGTVLAEKAMEAGLVTGVSENLMEYSYRFKDPDVAKLHRVAGPAAELFRHCGLRLNYLIRNGAEYERKLEPSLLSYLKEKNSALKEGQLDYLLDIVARSSESEKDLLERDRAFRGHCAALYGEIRTRCLGIGEEGPRNRLCGICEEFIEEMRQ